MQEEYFLNKKKEVLDEITAYEAKISEINEALQFETDAKKHAGFRQKRMELESSIEIARAKFNVIGRERDDQIKVERAARYDDLKGQIGNLSMGISKFEDKFYKLLAETLVPDLDEFEKIFQERAALRTEINHLSRESNGELEGIPMTMPTVLGLRIRGNDFRAPAIMETLVEAIQLHHRKYQASIKQGIKPKFELSKELLAEVGYFNVTAGGELRRQSPEQLAADHMKLEANRDKTLVKDEVN